MSRPPIKAMKVVKNWCSKHRCNNPDTGFECPLGWCRTSIPREWKIREKSREEDRPHGKWEYLKEHITEMRDADGELNQKETCQFILELMGVIEKEGEAE